MSQSTLILTEMLHAERSKEHIGRIGQWVAQSPERVAALIALFTGQPPRLAELAAWVVGDLGVQQPELFAPWVPRLIAFIEQPGLHNSLYRNALRVLQSLDIPPDLQGQCADVCFRLFDSPQEAIAVRVFAGYTLINICKAEPDLWPELLIRAEEYAVHGSPGMKACYKKVRFEYNRKAHDKRK